MAIIGVLALQGNVAFHQAALAQHDFAVKMIRQPQQLADVQGLVIPGGESTALLKLMAPWDFSSAINDCYARGVPIFGSCAGAILLAESVAPDQSSLGLIPMSIERNAYGRQLDSFVGKADQAADELVFIRAPKIAAVGDRVQVMLRHQGEPVLVQCEHAMAATYHPEMSDYQRVADFFRSHIH